MEDAWFPTQLLDICLMTIGTGFLLGFLFSIARNIFFAGNGD